MRQEGGFTILSIQKFCKVASESKLLDELCNGVKFAGACKIRHDGVEYEANLTSRELPERISKASVQRLSHHLAGTILTCVVFELDNSVFGSLLRSQQISRYSLSFPPLAFTRGNTYINVNQNSDQTVQTPHSMFKLQIVNACWEPHQNLQRTQERAEVAGILSFMYLAKAE